MCCIVVVVVCVAEVTMTPAPGFIYRTSGGILDLYLFLGPQPESVISQYTEVVQILHLLLFLLLLLLVFLLLLFILVLLHLHLLLFLLLFLFTPFLLTPPLFPLALIFLLFLFFLLFFTRRLTSCTLESCFCNNNVLQFLNC